MQSLHQIESVKTLPLNPAKHTTSNGSRRNCQSTTRVSLFQPMGKKEQRNHGHLQNLGHISIDLVSVVGNLINYEEALQP